MTDHPRPAARLLCLQCLSFRNRDQIAHLNSRPVCLTCVEKMRDLVGTAAFEELKFVFRATGEPAVLSAPAAETPVAEKPRTPRATIRSGGKNDGRNTDMIPPMPMNIGLIHASAVLALGTKTPLQPPTAGDTKREIE